MTRKRQLPPAPLPATPVPATAESQPTVKGPMRVSPLDLELLSKGDRPVPTSLSMATAHVTDRDRYTDRERKAATAAPAHAMDYGMSRNAQDALTFVDATGWPGFQILGLLAQLPEYRTMHETLADETVRTWGQVRSSSDDDASVEKITKLTQALERFGIRSLIREAVIHDQAYGGAHIFPRLKVGATPVKTDVPVLLTPTFFKKGCLDSFVAVEPMWVTPSAYNASDPTLPNFYKPEKWYMLSVEVHATRLHTMISRPVSDLLKAAYSFRGVSITQLAMPYVDNWLRTRQSVSDTVKQFSITYLQTDMAQMLQPGGATNLINRVQLFNLTRDNRNVGICDKMTEDFAQINTPLSGLDALQAQAQEQMCAVSRQPLVKAFGITPAGLNANSDGEIRVWYDFVAGYQSHNLSPLMLWILQLIQLSEFGEIDAGLSWDWNPLYELTDVELADVREKNARTDLTYLEAGVISGETVQERLSQDPLSGYAGILADRDELDEVEDIAKAMLAKALTPQPQDPANDPDADQSNAQAASARGDQPVDRG